MSNRLSLGQGAFKDVAAQEDIVDVVFTGKQHDSEAWCEADQDLGQSSCKQELN